MRMAIKVIYFNKLFVLFIFANQGSLPSLRAELSGILGIYSSAPADSRAFHRDKRAAVISENSLMRDLAIPGRTHLCRPGGPPIRPAAAGQAASSTVISASQSRNVPAAGAVAKVVTGQTWRMRSWKSFKATS